MPSSLRSLPACVFAAVFFGHAVAQAQSAAVQPGAAANREYAAVFAHSDNPCSADYATAPYMQCMSNEVSFIELHLNAFVLDLRGIVNSPEELASLDRSVADFRTYRVSLCDLPNQRFKDGTIKGPMSAECQLRLDRDYMKQLSVIYILSQFPK
jgi:hypothetical protein